jgi:hypothetical protein
MMPMSTPKAELEITKMKASYINMSMILDLERPVALMTPISLD